MPERLKKVGKTRSCDPEVRCVLVEKENKWQTPALFQEPEILNFMFYCRPKETTADVTAGVVVLKRNRDRCKHPAVLRQWSERRRKPLPVFLVFPGAASKACKSLSAVSYTLPTSIVPQTFACNCALAGSISASGRCASDYPSPVRFALREHVIAQGLPGPQDDGLEVRACPPFFFFLLSCAGAQMHEAYGLSPFHRERFSAASCFFFFVSL